MKTCGIVERDEAGGSARFAEPIGVLAGIVPCTNPTSTTVFKALLALKTRNCIVFSPHPRTTKCTIEAARIVRDAAVECGAPANCIAWIDIPTIQLCNELMTHPKVVMIVATGASALVKAAFSCGKPAFGGGAGNTPVIIDETADIPMAVNSVLLSKTFDNGMICASEQAIIAVESVAEQVRDEFRKRGAYFLSTEEKELVGNFILTEKGALNPAAVGQSAYRLAELAGIEHPPVGCRLLLGELNEVGPAEKLSHEKLCPCLGFFTCPDFDHALQRGLELVEYGGMGHTSVLYTDLSGSEKDARIAKFQSTMPTGRTLVCMPSSQGAIGNVFNFRQMPSLSLGCGSWGKNATAEGLQAKHLLNCKQICERREHVLWFKVPPSIYFNRGTILEAFRDLQSEGLCRAFIVTDPGLEAIGHVNRLVDGLRSCNINSDVFAEVLSDNDIKTVAMGVARMNLYNPDVIIAFGGGSPIAAAKVMRLFYEHPDANLDQLYTRFMDIQKRIVQFPKLGQKLKKLVCIPTTSGIGSEMTPIAVVCNHEKNIVYSLADYSLTPDMAVIDADFALTIPKDLAARGGFGAMVNAIESYVSMLSNDYTQGLSLRAISLLFKNLEKSVNDNDAKAREACHNASAIAGMAYANAFVGICSSMAHQIGPAFHIPHGLAVSMLICQTIKFNAEEAPAKQGTFSQYPSPKAKEQYAEIADSMYLTSPEAPLDQKVDSLIQALQNLKVALGIPQSIKDYGVDEDKFMSMVNNLALSAFDDQCTGSNPRYPLVSELKALLIDGFYGEFRKSDSETIHDKVE